MESATFRQWLAEQGCSFEQHKRGKGRGHAAVTVRRGELSSELPLIGSNKQLDHDTIERVRRELGLENVAVPGYPH